MKRLYTLIPVYSLLIVLLLRSATWATEGPAYFEANTLALGGSAISAISKSSFVNPAALGNIDKITLGIYSETLYSGMAGIKGIAINSSLSNSLKIGLMSFETRGDILYKEKLIGSAVALNLTPQFSLGLKMQKRSINVEYQNEVNEFNYTLGILNELHNITFGAVVTGFAKKGEPSETVIGINIPISSNLRCLADVNNKREVSVGLETNFGSGVIGRCGLDPSGLKAGIGLKIEKGITLNYAYFLHSLGDTHSFSLVLSY